MTATVAEPISRCGTDEIALFSCKFRAKPYQVACFCATAQPAHVRAFFESVMTKRPYHSSKPVTEAPMPAGLAPRLLAAALLADAVNSGHAVEDRLGLAETGGRFADLSVRDRALARTIVVVSLRRLGTLRAAVLKFLEKGLPRSAVGLEWILVIGAAQILFLDVPDHAAVDLAVHAARRDPKLAGFAALTNAVLRNITRQRDELLANPDPFIDTPSWLAARWRKTYGEDVAARMARMHQTGSTLDITVKSDPEIWAERLGGIVLPTGSVRLDGHDAIEELAGYAEGEWWVQDAAAALPARLLNPQPNERVADLCAAPGGKTAQLAMTGAHVVAIDRSAERLKRLTANLARLHLSADVMVGDVLNVKLEPFDAILLDAPCTSTGTIRRHPDVAWTKKISDITSLAELQSKMLDRAANLLRPGGRLVYCTCSIEPEEGEQQIAAFLRRNPDFMRDPIRAEEIGGLSECLTEHGEVRTLPVHLSKDTERRSGLDGFFAARLKCRRES